jgi:hypothetical protein
MSLPWDSEAFLLNGMLFFTALLMKESRSYECCTVREIFGKFSAGRIHDTTRRAIFRLAARIQGIAED